MIKSASNVDTLALQAKTGESLLVRDICVGNIPNGHVTVQIERVTVGYFRVDNDQLGNVLHFPVEDVQKKTILGFLWDEGIFKGYPIAEGETLEFTGESAGDLSAAIIYDVYDAPDIKNTDQNGSKSSNYVFINEGTVSASVNTGTNTLYDKIITTAEFPDFPFGQAVPANTQIKIHGLMASERAGDDGSTANNFCVTTYYKFVKDREVMFDEDRNGIYCRGNTVMSGGAFEPANGKGLAGDYSHLINRKPLMFNPPLTFESGEVLDIYVSTIVGATAGTLTSDELAISLIEEVIR